jgi:hypothetical protein
MLVYSWLPYWNLLQNFWHLKIKIKNKIGDQKPQDTLTFFALLENNSQELLFFPSQFVAIFTKKR